ncbi:DUF7266 family protein [Natronorubrum thiooxidans]|uniref:Flagellin N-terminal-like domain-containing protein n=1 Tax=Natronorubrum thiooxidans TaxID=308853 RepID=A0A1N7DD56_9EURY|nr:hypothetical protein [Natronorubrum thiooxidans]SIR73675.1 hypothetical protein SAMN05421752_102163 [Natronorubrum thiooxidans]
MIGPRHETDRGMSIALTHVLTIGITTILIAMLLMSGSTMLETETERSAQTSLETVGERLAGEIDNVDQIANDSSDRVTLTGEHPRSVANSQYTVALKQDCSEVDASLLNDSTTCLRLTAQDIDVTVYVPVAVDGNQIKEPPQSVQGGTIEIKYEGDGIELEAVD